jgi:hypothetical protein
MKKVLGTIIAITTLIIIIAVNIIFLYNFSISTPKSSAIVDEEQKYSLIDSKEPPSSTKEKLEFVSLPEFSSPKESSVYGDVLAHSAERPFGDAHGRSTNVHETAHGIHSYLRNKYSKSKRYNGLYCLNGKAIVLQEPNIRKHQIIEFIPPNLRGYRFETYISGQKAWDDTPLYVYDEWVAYVLGGKCNVQDVENNKFNEGWTDGVSGCLSFSIYAIATCMTVQKYDSQYWQNNNQFRLFTVYMLKQAYNTFMAGRKMEQFKWDKQDKLYDQLLNSEQAIPMRNFIKNNLDGVWLAPFDVDSTEYEIYQTADPEQL